MWNASESSAGARSARGLSWLVLTTLALAGCGGPLEGEALPELAQAQQALSPVGNHDVSVKDGDNNWQYGWACDPDSYWAPLTIKFYVYSSMGQPVTYYPVGYATANVQREAAVGSMCGGYSAHGFAYNIPRSTICNIYKRNIYNLYAQAYAIDPQTGAEQYLGGKLIYDSVSGNYVYYCP